MYHQTRRKIYFFQHRKTPMKSLSLSKVVEGFTLACNARQLSWHTIDDYTRTLKRFINHVGDVPINTITSTHVNAFMSAQAQRVGKKTCLNYHIGLSALWTWAEKEGYVQKHVVHMVERPQPKKIVIKPFSEVEVRALLSSVQYAPNKNRAMILLLLDTGARASEICNLKREDIDLVKRQLKVTGKGDKERFLPFSPRTGSSLFSHLATLSGDPFQMSRTSMAQYLRRLGARAGVPDSHPHRFRHTFAITYLRNGGDPYSLQEILGHTTMDTVKIYLHLAQVDLDSAHKKASPVEGWKL